MWFKRWVFSLKKDFLRYLPLTKKKNSKKLHFNRIYKSKCKISNDIYGKIICYFKIRAYKRLGITPLTLKNPKESAIFDHILYTGHNLLLMILKTLSKTNDLDFSLESNFLYQVMIFKQIC